MCSSDLDESEYAALILDGDETSRLLRKPGNPVIVEMHQNSPVTSFHPYSRPINRNASEAEAVRDLFRVQRHADV